LKLSKEYITSVLTTQAWTRSSLSTYAEVRLLQHLFSPHY